MLAAILLILYMLSQIRYELICYNLIIICTYTSQNKIMQSMSPGEIEAHRVEGLGNTNSPTDCGYVLFSQNKIIASIRICLASQDNCCPVHRIWQSCKRANKKKS